MKLIEIIDIYNMVDEIVNNNAKIKDFGIDDNNGVWVTLDNGKIIDFYLDKK